MVKKLLDKTYSPVLAVAWNLLLIYLVYQVTRLEYYLENANYLHYTSEVFRGGLVFDTSAILYTNALYIVLMLFPWHIKENRGYHRLCKWVYLVINGVAIAINLADSVYFKYTMRRTTTTVFGEFSNEGNLSSVIGAEFVNHWYLVALFAVLMLLLWKLYATPQLDHRKMLHRWKYNLICLLSLLIITPFFIAGIRGGWTTAVRPVTLSNANQYVSSPTDAALVLNTPFSLIRTVGKNVFSVPEYFADSQELESIFTPIHTPVESTPLSSGGIGGGYSSSNLASPSSKKNVVILIVESFGREYIGALNKDLENGQYKGYTPHVDSLIAKSTTFTHSYCNGRKSIDGMPSILSSIPMFIEPFVLTPSSMNHVTGIAGILGAEGYETAFFHGAQRNSMGFQAFARKTGFQNYYGREDFCEDGRFGDDSEFDGMWAIWDEPFLQYFAAKISDLKEPFMTAVFTATSHHPYAIPEKYKEVYPEENLIIHKCIRYTDMAIGKFFEKVSREPWFENTIFVLTSDHTNHSDHAFYQSTLGGFCSPIVIFEPGQEPQVIDKIAQQIDIMPTVLGMLGYNKKFFAFGIDLFNTPAEETWAVNYLNGIYQYVKHGHVLQFDGTKTTAVYSLQDSLMQHNLLKESSSQDSSFFTLHSSFSQMERELKAIIQQYMERMTQNRLMP